MLRAAFDRLFNYVYKLEFGHSPLAVESEGLRESRLCEQYMHDLEVKLKAELDDPYDPDELEFGEHPMDNESDGLREIRLCRQYMHALKMKLKAELDQPYEHN